jgi:hypothetical protein
MVYYHGCRTPLCDSYSRRGVISIETIQIFFIGVAVQVVAYFLLKWLNGDDHSDN